MKQLRSRFPKLRYEKLFLIKTDEGQRVTTTQETAFIKDCKKRVLADMGIKLEYLVYLRNQQKEFYEKLDNKLYELKKFKLVRQGYSVVFPDLEAKYDFRFKLDDGDKQLYIAGANKLICNFLGKEALNNQNKARRGKEVLENYKADEYNDNLTITEAFSEKVGKLTKLPPDHYEKQTFLINDLVQL